MSLPLSSQLFCRNEFRSDNIRMPFRSRSRTTVKSLPLRIAPVRKIAKSNALTIDRNPLTPKLYLTSHRQPELSIPDSVPPPPQGEKIEANDFTARDDFTARRYFTARDTRSTGTNQDE